MAASRSGALEDKKNVRPVIVDQNAALSALKETGTRLTDQFKDARESYRAKAMAEARGPTDAERSSRVDALKSGRSAGTDDQDRFGLHSMDDDWQRSSAFGDWRQDDDERRAFGADPFKAVTAIRAYERAGASTSTSSSFSAPY